MKHTMASASFIRSISLMRIMLLELANSNAFRRKKNHAFAEERVVVRGFEYEERILAHIIHKTIRKRRNSAWNVGLMVKVLCARLLMSSREQSREIRTNSHKAPPLIMSFAFISDTYSPLC